MLVVFLAALSLLPLALCVFGLALGLGFFGLFVFGQLPPQLLCHLPRLCWTWVAGFFRGFGSYIVFAVQRAGTSEGPQEGVIEIGVYHCF